ncbi:MAG: hypothetical protein AAF467_12380 [Actinomycetota bacterium]
MNRNRTPNNSSSPEMSGAIYGLGLLMTIMAASTFVITGVLAGPGGWSAVLLAGTVPGAVLLFAVAQVAYISGERQRRADQSAGEHADRRRPERV